MSRQDPISAYAEAQATQLAAICDVLRDEIDSVLPKATSRIWHAMPVWFVGESPVVGFKAGAKHITLLFWNGQSFEEPGLIPVGKFRAAQVKFQDVAEVVSKDLRRWLKKAGTMIWDIKTVRRGIADRDA
jgi:hypothetical protein